MSVITDEEAESQSVAELLWGVRQARTRGPKPAFSLDDIAAAAVGVADADGLDAVSMQRVAAELGVTKMALYRYVDSKAELAAIMIERAVGAPPDLSGTTGGWRARIAEFARLLAASWHDHPWLPTITVGDRIMGPNEVGWIEVAVAALDGIGLTGAERTDAVFMICSHVRNTHSLSAAGTQPWKSDGRLRPSLQGLLRANVDRFPALNEATSLAEARHADNGREFGMQLILDGLTAVVDKRRPTRRSRPRSAAPAM